MGKRQFSSGNQEEQAGKHLKVANGITPGDILTDRTGCDWKLGKGIGQGGFGEIFLASNNVVKKEVSSDSEYVAKIELHSNGPLFVEVNCYLRIGKLETINEWKTKKNLKSLGMVNYVSSGSHYKNGTKYRFLILPRFNCDLESILNKCSNRFNLKTVINVGLQLLDTLEYIHEGGFVHADIKASNIVLGKKAVAKPKSVAISSSSKYVSYRATMGNRRMSKIRSCRLKKFIGHNLRTNKNLVNVKSLSVEQEQCEEAVAEECDVGVDMSNQVYLLDFGLASKFVDSRGEHKDFCQDNRRAHAGTILFCSLDAHNGAQSRRSDLECLGYNMIYWLNGSLPWSDDVSDCDLVKRKKEHCFRDIDEFLKECFGRNPPNFLVDFFYYLKTLHFKQAPDYTYCKRIFVQGLKEFGYKLDGLLDFDNKEGWGKKRRPIRKNCENKFIEQRKIVVNSVIRAPLKSNAPIFIKPVLRGKSKKLDALNWSKILLDPEDILKSRKKCKEEDVNVENKLHNLDIYKLNPTYAMIKVYNKFFGKSVNDNAKLKTESIDEIEGYTAAMLEIYRKLKSKRRVGRPRSQIRPLVKTSKIGRHVYNSRTQKTPIPNTRRVQI